MLCSHAVIIDKDPNTFTRRRLYTECTSKANRPIGARHTSDVTGTCEEDGDKRGAQVIRTGRCQTSCTINLVTEYAALVARQFWILLHRNSAYYGDIALLMLPQILRSRMGEACMELFYCTTGLIG